MRGWKAATMSARSCWRSAAEPETKRMTTPTLHEFADSGNCYKIRLTAAHFGIAIERRQYDIMKGETRTPR